MAILVFTDTETTGLNYDGDDEIWMLHAKAAHTGTRRHFDSFTRLINVDPEKIDRLPQKYQDIFYQTWIDPALQNVKCDSYCAGQEFISWIHDIAKGDGEEKLHFVAANPHFDASMINQCLIDPKDFFQYFDYHLIDIEAYTLGYLRATEGIRSEVPFKSDDLNKALGLYDEDAHKHDAISDTDWLIDMWLKMHDGNF